jgi:CheY-like chemotaxis protein
VLNGALILVAEDEPFIALDVALAIEDAGGEVAGPAASVREALALIDSSQIVAAILDVNLADGDISPVAERLLIAGIPIIVQTGIGLPPNLAARFPDLPVHIKPCSAASLVVKLEALIAALGRQGRIG